MSAPPFVPGIELSRLFYREAVRPILDAAFPRLPHAAALLGDGSEVLGYDSPRSTDHDWGPRLLLFLTDADQDALGLPLTSALGERLPHEFRGYPTSFGAPNATGTRLLEATEQRPLAHRVEIHAVGRYLSGTLGFDARRGVTLLDWLSTPSQLLLSVTAGAVYHDDPGELSAARAAVSWYPHDVWLYLLAAQWARIGQEEAFVGRAAEVGDELGSRLLAGRLVRDVMRLCFLIERRYAPYGKWLCTGFETLACGPMLAPRLRDILASTDGADRQRRLNLVYEDVARRFNALGVVDAVEPTVHAYHSRPYDVIGAGRFVAALRAAIGDPDVRRLTLDAGSVDQFVDSTEVLSRASMSRAATRAVHFTD